MIFATHNAIENIFAGVKTQTRRRVKPNDFHSRIMQQVLAESPDGRSNRVRYGVGFEYAIQPGRGKRSVGRIRITNIRKEPVNAITEADAIAEGFASRDEFLDVWRSLYGQDVDMTQPCWVIEFELAGEV